MKIMTLNEIRMRRTLLTLGEVQRKLDSLTVSKRDVVVTLVTREDIRFLQERLDEAIDNLEHMMD